MGLFIVNFGGNDQGRSFLFKEYPKRPLDIIRLDHGSDQSIIVFDFKKHVVHLFSGLVAFQLWVVAEPVHEEFNDVLDNVFGIPALQLDRIFKVRHSFHDRNFFVFLLWINMVELGVLLLLLFPNEVINIRNSNSFVSDNYVRHFHQFLLVLR